MTLLVLEVGPLRTRHLAVLSAAVVSAPACDGPQSAFVTAGRDAAEIAELFTVMTVGALMVWAAVVAIAVYAIRVGESHSQRAANLLIIGGGVAVPTVVLGALIAYGMPIVPSVLVIPKGARSIQITAKQWWWRVEYRTAAGAVETANELRLPVGERVELRLASADVIHSFWAPSLAGKMDVIPGRLTRLALEPTRTGTFRGTCAEYCGTSHALMAFSVVVIEPQEFRTWLDAQTRPAEVPADPLASRGGTIFVREWLHGLSYDSRHRGARPDWSGSDTCRRPPAAGGRGASKRAGRASSMDRRPGSRQAWRPHAGLSPAQCC